MEDLRKNRQQEKYMRKLKWLDFLSFIKKNWLKILLIIIFLTIFVFPSFVGNLIGLWFNKLATSILNNLTF